jgi:hypothetical protein
MSGNTFVRPERVKTALDNKKLHFSAECPTAKGKNSSLTTQFHDNGFKFIVYTNDPQDQDKRNDNGRIIASLGLLEIMQFFSCMEDVINYTGTELPYGFKVQNKGYIFPNGQKSEEPVVKSMLHVFKEKDGVIYFSVTAQNRPKIKFPIQSSDWHVFLKHDGTALTPAESSERCARGYLTLLQGMIAVMADSKWVEPKPKQFNKDGNQQGGQQRQYNNNNNQRSNSYTDTPSQPVEEIDIADIDF